VVVSYERDWPGCTCPVPARERKQRVLFILVHRGAGLKVANIIYPDRASLFGLLAKALAERPTSRGGIAE